MVNDPVQRAFRAGLVGAPYPAARNALAEMPAPFARGPNEEIVLAIERLPGLGDPRSAYEVGRVLRYLAQLFDRAGAPARVGREFRENLALAVLTHAMRRHPRPWTAEDTVDMFMEMYGRVLGGDAAETARIRRLLLERARGSRGTATRARRLAFLRRGLR